MPSVEPMDCEPMKVEPVDDVQMKRQPLRPFNNSREIEAEIDTLTHVFHLRTDFDVEIQLPSDLTPREAARIAAFVSVLPIEE